MAVLTNYNLTSNGGASLASDGGSSQPLTTTKWVSTNSGSSWTYDPTLNLSGPVVTVNNGSNVSTFTGTTQDDNTASFFINAITRTAQTFTATTSGTLVEASLRLVRLGNPNFNMRLLLHTASILGGPTGAPVASSNLLAASTVSTSAGLVAFTFADAYSITAGNVYAIAYRIDNIVTVTSGNSVRVIQSNVNAVTSGGGSSYGVGNIGY